MNLLTLLFHLLICCIVETREQKKFRDFLRERYTTDGPTRRRNLRSTSELIYEFSPIGLITYSEALAVLDGLNIPYFSDSNGLVKWMLYDKADPIDSWL